MSATATATMTEKAPKREKKAAPPVFGEPPSDMNGIHARRWRNENERYALAPGAHERWIARVGEAVGVPVVRLALERKRIDVPRLVREGILIRVE